MLLLKNVLVATDFSGASDAALRYGRDFARTYGALLHVVHVVDDVASHVMPMTALPDIGTIQMDLQHAAEAELDARLADAARQLPAVRTVILTSAAPAQAIVAYAEEAGIDLLVIGTHGRGGLARLFMGSVAQHIVRTAPCPVLTVRQPERDFLVADPPAADDTTGVTRGQAH